MIFNNDVLDLLFFSFMVILGIVLDVRDFKKRLSVWKDQHKDFKT